MTSLADRFRSWVRRQPSAPALVGLHGTVSYAEVDRRSDDVAAQLAACGVPAGTAVGLLAGRGNTVPVAILGILKHGCAYVPIDPAYPSARQQFVQQDAGLRWMLVEEPEGVRVVEVDGAAPDRPPLPADTAYVIYTSGSTGQPKGVVVRQSHVGALLDGAAGHYTFGPDDVWTMFHSHCFDVSVWEMWGAWNSGGQLLVVPDAFVRTAPMLVDLLRRYDVSVLSLVPTAFHHLTQALDRSRRTLPALREIVLAGEPIKIDVVNRWRALGAAPAARIVNMYGITEITVHATFCELTDPLTARYPGTTPIGVALPHLRLDLVDPDGTEVPPGVVGEIRVEGDSVTDGYIGRPEATAQRFGTGPGGRRAYRSGDFAIRAEDGGLHFVGRRDDQVQIKGFRIEPAEISAAVESHPDVTACVVTTRASRSGDPELVAHCVLTGPAAERSSLVLRGHLADRLPRYMMPTEFRFHASFPVTANGKVDRAALDAGDRPEQPTAPPSTPTPTASPTVSPTAEATR